jgi:uncharacterized protein DUF5658
MKNAKRSRNICKPNLMSGDARLPLFVLFMQIQAADILTTNVGLGSGRTWEANPIFAWLQDELGAAWWLPKIAISIAVGLVLLRRYRSQWWPLALASGIAAIPVLINVASLK